MTLPNKKKLVTKASGALLRPLIQVFGYVLDAFGMYNSGVNF